MSKCTKTRAEKSLVLMFVKPFRYLQWLGEEKKFIFLFILMYMLYMLIFSVRFCFIMWKMIPQHIFINICCYSVALCPYSEPWLYSLNQVIYETQLPEGGKLLFVEFQNLDATEEEAQETTVEEYIMSQDRASIPMPVRRGRQLNKRSQKGRQNGFWEGTLNPAGPSPN